MEAMIHFAKGIERDLNKFAAFFGLRLTSGKIEALNN